MLQKEAGKEQKDQAEGSSTKQSTNVNTDHLDIDLNNHSMSEVSLSYTSTEPSNRFSGSIASFSRNFASAYLEDVVSLSSKGNQLSLDIDPAFKGKLSVNVAGKKYQVEHTGLESPTKDKAPDIQSNPSTERNGGQITNSASELSEINSISRKFSRSFVIDLNGKKGYEAKNYYDIPGVRRGELNFSSTSTIATELAGIGQVAERNGKLIVSLDRTFTGQFTVTLGGKTFELNQKTKITTAEPGETQKHEQVAPLNLAEPAPADPVGTNLSPPSEKVELQNTPEEAEAVENQKNDKQAEAFKALQSEQESYSKKEQEISPATAKEQPVALASNIEGVDLQPIEPQSVLHSTLTEGRKKGFDVILSDLSKEIASFQIITPGGQNLEVNLNRDTRDYFDTRDELLNNALKGAVNDLESKLPLGTRHLEVTLESIDKLWNSTDLANILARIPENGKSNGYSAWIKSLESRHESLVDGFKKGNIDGELISSSQAKADELLRSMESLTEYGRNSQPSTILRSPPSLSEISAASSLEYRLSIDRNPLSKIRIQAQDYIQDAKIKFEKALKQMPTLANQTIKTGAYIVSIAESGVFLKGEKEPQMETFSDMADVRAAVIKGLTSENARFGEFLKMAPAASAQIETDIIKNPEALLTESGEIVARFLDAKTGQIKYGTISADGKIQLKTDRFDQANQSWAKPIGESQLRYFGDKNSNYVDGDMSNSITESAKWNGAKISYSTAQIIDWIDATQKQSQPFPSKITYEDLRQRVEKGDGRIELGPQDSIIHAHFESLVWELNHSEAKSVTIPAKVIAEVNNSVGLVSNIPDGDLIIRLSDQPVSAPTLEFSFSKENLSREQLIFER